MKLECAHADTCTPDYWGGHYLPHISIPVFHGMTLEQIKASLKDELNQDAIAGMISPRNDEWYIAAEEAITLIAPSDPNQTKFFMDLEPLQDTDDYDGYSVYAYFVFVELE
jgi:hypothetical protein